MAKTDATQFEPLQFLGILNKVTCTALFISLIGVQWAAGQLTSGNPIIRHIRSADPSAHVWNDGRVWVYASHDQDDATDYSTIDGYHVFSSSDLVEWTDHGEILHSRDVSWGNPQGGFMFAPSAAHKDGIYYLYFPHLSAEWQWRVGVATSDKPEGPFTDIGRYIAGTDQIDPACFMDDDGQAYLIWGGDSQSPRIARLKENMTELAEEPRVIEYGGGNFGEGPYMHKRNGIYYFSYTCHTCWPYQGYYAMGDNPYGPFEYKGELNPNPPGAQDHHSMVEYHGQWYYFYHVGNFGPGGSLYRRNICMDSLFYNPDGTMRVVVQTQTGVGQDPIGMTAGKIVPGRVEAEDYFRQVGVETLVAGDSSTWVSGIQDADWFDFVLEVLGSETYMAGIKVSDPVEGSWIYLLVDEVLQDSIFVEAGRDTLEVPVFLHKGKHTLKLLFSYPDSTTPLMDVDWMELSGEKTYYTISASASGGGSIQPDGMFYLVSGDSVEFKVDWGLNQRPDTLYLDGVPWGPSESFTIRNVSGNHTVLATFASCSGTPLNPVAQVNHGDDLPVQDISVTEGDDLVLRVEYDDPGIMTWLDPRGKSSLGNTLEIETINLFQGGTYAAYLTDSGGCKLRMNFSVSVLPLVLDVYQAEQWIDKSGVLNDICTDEGAGLHLGFINNGDWSIHRITIDEPGIYDVIARVATASGGGEIELSIGDRTLGSVPVSSDFSRGWQDWYTTSPVEAAFEAGTHDLRLTYRGGEGYLFNLNWFDLTYNRALPVTSATGPADPHRGLICYPLAGGAGMGIRYYLDEPSDVSVMIFNPVGLPTRTLLTKQAQPAGLHHLNWNGKNDEGREVPEGVYILVLSANGERKSHRILLTK